MSALSDKIISDAVRNINSLKLSIKSHIKKIIPLFKNAISSFKTYFLYKQNEMILKRRYINLAEYIYNKKISSGKTDFSHDDEYSRLITDITLIKSYIDEIEKK